MKKRIATIVALWCVGGGWLHAASLRQERLGWGELEARMADRKVSIVLPGGTEIKGRIQRVVPDGLWMQVSRTSDRRVQPKGAHLIPRASISVLRMEQNRHLYRWVGLLGAAAAAGGIVAAQSIEIYEGPALVVVPLTIAAGVAGSAVGGYYAGKTFDKRVVEILVIPEGK